MYKIIVIEFALLTLFIISCNDIDRVPTETHNVEYKSNYISSVIALNGSDLVFKQYSKGCVNEETQRIEISEKLDKNIAISYFRNDVKVLDGKVFDSFFQVFIKSFIYECDELLKDTLSGENGFGTIETIEISDGLDIIEVGARGLKQRNPFDDLVNTICSKVENRMLLDRW